MQRLAACVQVRDMEDDHWRITARTAQGDHEMGSQPVLKGFVSSTGKPFDARLRLEGGRFDFCS